MTSMRWLTVALTAGLVACTFPAAAGATDYCVDSVLACGAKNVGSFEEALGKAAANDDPDRIYLGPGPHQAPNTGGFEYENLAGQVQILGTGREGPLESVITGLPATAGHVLSLMGAPGTSIEDVKIELPEDVASGLSGLETNGAARRVSVGGINGQQNAHYGVTLHGGVVEESVVRLTPGTSVAIFMDSSGGTVRHSGVFGHYGIISYGGTVERSFVFAEGAGILAYDQPTTVSSSQVNVAGATGIGISALVSAGFDTKVIADGVNIIGPGGPNGTAVRASTNLAPDSSASVTMRNSLVRGFGTTLHAQTTAGGSGSAHIAASYSDYEPDRIVSSPANATIAEANISNVGDAGFENVSRGDYRLLSSSPLVDAGDPSTAQGIDIADQPLVTDGNLDGTARRDIGAFEVPGPLPGAQGATGGGAGGNGDAGADRQAPVMSRFSASTARRPRLRYTLSEQARVTIAIQRVIRRDGKTRYRTVGRLTRNGAKGLNRTVLKGRIGSRVLRPGRYRAVARATDVAGNRSAAKRARFRIVRR